MTNDLKDYSITLSVSPSAILSNFDEDERQELLDHFQTPEAFCDWVMSGILDYWQGDGLGYELDCALWNASDRLASPEAERYW